MPSVEGLAARRAALSILDAVLRRGQTIEAASGRASVLSPPDRGLAVAIAGEVLRRMPDLDALIDSATRNRLADDSKARMVLRLALAQKIGLDTPAHALVATALPLVDGGPRRLVHGVLGTLLRRGVPAGDAPNLPSDVEHRWRSAWGDDVVAAARRQIVQRPPLDLSFANDSRRDAFVEEVGGIGLALRHARIDSRQVDSLPGFDRGDHWVQDIAASLPARLIPADAKVVLDLCAAPGGKTMQLAAAGHDVTALDRDPRRLDRLRANLERTGLKAISVVGDALSWTPPRRFDAILLDAPCSATGTFRRHPEVLYRARPSIIAETTELQRAMLERAGSWLTPGGTLVYAVCSLEPAEGEEQVGDFLDRNPSFQVAPPVVGELPDFAIVDGRGYVRTLPGMIEAEGGLDGFFIARLVRTA